MEDENIITPSEFSDICPIADKDFHNEMSILVQEPGFRNIINMFLPGYKYSQLVRVLLSLNNKNDWQLKIMKPFMDGLLAKTTSGLTVSGLENLDKNTPNVFITNHRDIVLDSAQLSYSLIKGGFDTCEIAIGNNLLIFDWINKLVRLNKCFIVKRNLGRMQTLAAAIQLSKYIHFALTEKHASIWIAQREGRCKDSNDRTQESLIKMLSYGNRDKSFIESLKELNIAPIAISYEYDPNDYLKAREFLLKSKDPNFKKSPEDDLISMKTGLLGFKGQVHYSFTPCINNELDNIPEDLDKFLAISRVCTIIDHCIHANYKIFKTNYMAHDILFDNKKFADKYTPEELDGFKKYLSDQIDKTDIPLQEFDRYYMYSKMLQMYSNPLTNQLDALG
ncbi:MAG: 1-acyl-sn-glycerol-3-phosphate acyltransferase [Sodaliphilus sp.]|nr:1-acyl-sn-glycerol-3-phosphate acyltransferase [Sodaliphilus sp.]